MRTFFKHIIVVAVLLLSGCYQYPVNVRAAYPFNYPAPMAIAPAPIIIRRQPIFVAPVRPVIIAPRPPIYFSYGYRHRWSGYDRGMGGHGGWRH